jgi:hypothetical protein
MNEYWALVKWLTDMEKLSTQRKTRCSATASITNPYDLTWGCASVFIPRLGRYNLFWYCFPFVLTAVSNHRQFSTNLTMRTWMCRSPALNQRQCGNFRLFLSRGRSSRTGISKNSQLHGTWADSCSVAQEIPRNLQNSMAPYCVHSSMPTDPNLKQPNSVHILAFHFPNILCNNILPSRLTSSKRNFLFGLLSKIMSALLTSYTRILYSRYKYKYGMDT